MTFEPLTAESLEAAEQLTGFTGKTNTERLVILIR